MKKNGLYIIIALIVGLLGGWLIFGSSAEESSGNAKHSSADTEMWTCSMHPQIMKNEPGDCPVCGMELIPAEAGSDGLAVNEIKMTENALALANIQTLKVGDGSNETDDSISLSGKIATNEEASSVQSSYFDGRIERLNINFEGQDIRTGQLLASIYAPNLVAAQQELITASSLKESQPALYNAVRNKLKLWKLSDSQINSIESSGKVRDNFPVYATVSGTVQEVLAKEGDYVKQGQALLKVSNLNTVWAEFDAYEHQISQFKEGQAITVTSNGYPNKEFEATISFIDPILNNETRTVTLRAELKNKDGLFKPGMFITGKIEAKNASEEPQLTVPASAVMWTGERSVVYLKTNSNQPVFEMREVTIGSQRGETYPVLSGLKNGDEVVVNGTFTVDAAAQLQGKRSMMNQKRKQNAMPTMDMPMDLPAQFQSDFTVFLPTYIKLKNALVASDAREVASYAELASEELKKSIDKGSFEAMAKSHISKSHDLLKAMAKTNDLESQRSHFVILNEHLIAVAKNVSGFDMELYIQKCPMANNNNGASWLSLESEIRNPYYGDAMLTCGSVIDTISK